MALQEALSCALRAAANSGQLGAVLSLMEEVPDINAKSRHDGKTALHHAVECVMRTGRRLCFEILAAHPKIDFSIEDKENNTALDRWDFEKYPDEELQQKHAELQGSVGLSL